jgi:CRP-like cAMP-binding protein
MSASLVDQYKALCSEQKIKANSAVVTFLEGQTEPEDLASWDLTGNVVGTKGAIAVARLARDALPNLTSLNLHGNNLGSAVTEELYKALVAHPALTSLDLSGNDIRLGGPALVELVKKNKKITTLNVRDTFLRPLFERLIAINVQNNKAEKAAAAGHKKTHFATFAFGDPAEDNTEAFAANEEDAFANFAKLDTENHVSVSFSKDAQGGKKVKRRPTVSAEVINEAEVDNFTPEVFAKDEKTREWLRSVLEHHDLFSHLDDRELLVCVDAAVPSSRNAGAKMFEEGDEDGDMFFIIGSGEVELSVGGEVSKTLKHGDCTQDLMLLYASAFSETATCVTDCVVYSLDRRTYKCVLSQASKKKRAMYEGFLSSVDKFKCLTPHELLQLADALKPAIFTPGQKLIKYGEDGTTFYLIVEGTVEVYGRNDAHEPIKVCEFTAGDCVGELEFLNDHKCVADVVAKDEVRTAKMNRHHFEMVMGPAKELLARTANESEVYTYYREKIEKMNESGKAHHE